MGAATTCVFVDKKTGKEHIGIKVYKKGLMGPSHFISLIISYDIPDVMRIVNYNHFEERRAAYDYSDEDLPGYENACFFAATYNKIHGV